MHLSQNILQRIIPNRRKLVKTKPDLVFSDSKNQVKTKPDLVFSDSKNQVKSKSSQMHFKTYLKKKKAYQILKSSNLSIEHFKKRIIIFQSSIRRHQIKKRYMILKIKLTVIAKFIRRIIREKRIQKRNQAIILLQAIFRGQLQRKKPIELSVQSLQSICKRRSQDSKMIKSLREANQELFTLSEELLDENELYENRIINGHKVLDYFECPISMEIPQLEDIVFCTVDGRIYSRKNIFNWMRANNGILLSPITRERVPLKSLIRFHKAK